MLAPYARLAGTERQIALLAAQLVGRGHTVHLLSPVGPMNSSFQAAGASIYEVPLLERRPLAGWLAVVNTLRRLEVDVVHAHAGLELAAAAGIARPRTPRVFTNHGYAATFDYWKDALCLPAIAAHVVTVSRSEAGKLLNYGVSATRLTVIHNGIQPLQCQEAAGADLRNKWQIPAGQMVVGTVGRLEPQKGHGVLLRALKLVEDLPFYAVIIGSGSLEQRLRSQAESLGIHERVRFVGQYQPIAEALSALDIFAFPSLWEPFGLAALEAMSMGLPVLASKVGGLSEFIEHDVSGLLVPAGEPEALANELRRLYSDEALRARLAAGGRQAASPFHAERMAEQYEGVYDELLKAAARPWRRREQQ